MLFLIQRLKEMFGIHFYLNYIYFFKYVRTKVKTFFFCIIIYNISFLVLHINYNGSGPLNV